MKLVQPGSCIACEIVTSKVSAEQAAVVAFAGGCLMGTNSNGPDELDATTRASFCARHYGLLAQTMSNARHIRDARAGARPS